MRLRRQLALALLLYVCWHVRLALADEKPDTSRVLRLMGRWGSAHACPVWPNLVLTSAHVIEPRPFEASVPPVPYRYQDGQGRTGIVTPATAERCADLATLHVRQELGWYVRADTEPKVGDTVWMLGFDWSSRSKAYGPKLIEARVTQVIAGNLYFDKTGEPGSSGSCVFNVRGEVVGINQGATIAPDWTVGHAVGIYGSWLEACK